MKEEGIRLATPNSNKTHIFFPNEKNSDILDKTKRAEVSIPTSTAELCLSERVIKNNIFDYC